MSTPQRILFLASTFPRWADDTMPPFIYLLAAQLQKLGLEIHVLAPHAPGASLSEQMGAVTVHRFRYAPVGLQSLAYGRGMLDNLREQPLRWLQLPGFLVSMAWNLIRLHRRYQFSVLHVHWIVPQGLVTALVSHFLSVPTLLSAHGSDVYACGKGLRGVLMRFAARRHDTVSVNSVPMQAELSRLCGMTPCIVPMGVDVSRFRNSSPAACAAANPTILFVGRLAEIKGVRYLINALPLIRQHHPGARILIIGDGAERHELERLATEQGLSESIDFTGAVPNDELPAYYRAADVFVAPSVVARSGETEALGVVLLEAAATALPIVSTNVGGTGDIVKHERTGLRVAERSAEEIAAAVTKLLSDPEYGKKLGAAAQAHVQEHYGWQTIAQRFAGIYAELSGAKFTQ